MAIHPNLYLQCNRKRDSSILAVSQPQGTWVIYLKSGSRQERRLHALAFPTSLIAFLESIASMSYLSQHFVAVRLLKFFCFDVPSDRWACPLKYHASLSIQSQYHYFQGGSQRRALLVEVHSNVSTLSMEHC